MKNKVTDGDMKPEYDFASMKGGVRGKYADKLREESNLVLLDPEIAEAFPSAEAVNEALRGVLRTTQAIRRSGGLPEKTLRPKRGTALSSPAKSKSPGKAARR